MKNKKFNLLYMKKFCEWLDRVLRICFPTPNMYGIHRIPKYRVRKRSLSL